MQKKDWLLAALFAVSAYVLYAALTVDFVYPGSSAQLMVSWLRLDGAEICHPLMALAFKLFGEGNALASVMGALSVFFVYLLTMSFFNRSLAAIVATVIYALSPAVMYPATRLDPGLFNTTLVMAGVVLVAFAVRRQVCSWVRYPLLVLAGLVLMATLASIVHARTFADCTFAVRSRLFPPGSFFVFAFSVLPFLMAVLSQRRAFMREESVSLWLYFLSLTFVSVLAIATPLSPFALMTEHGFFPVAATACTAMSAGFLTVYWFRARLGLIRLAAFALGGIYFFVILCAAVFAAFRFEPSRGGFADALAGIVLDEMGSRKILVTDGLFDNHLLLLNARRQQGVRLYSLAHEYDARYLERLAREAAELPLPDEARRELALTARLGVRAFLRDYFATDTNAAASAVVFGPASVFDAQRFAPIPGFATFGLDPSVSPDWSEWERVDQLLAVPRNWGSWNAIRRAQDPLVTLRFLARRHFGLVANDRAAYLYAQGDLSGAYELWALVFDSIDADNDLALLNLCRLSSQHEPHAAARRVELERKVELLVRDGRRRAALDRIVRPASAAEFGEEMRVAMEAVKTGELLTARDALERIVAAKTDDPLVWSLILSLDVSFGDADQARAHARAALKLDRELPLANYVMGSLALQGGEYAAAEIYLRKAVRVEKPLVMALNDLAETLRRLKRPEEAETYARQATENAPEFYLAWETLALAIVERGGDLAEAKRCIEKAVKFSRVNGRAEDIRMVISLARIQIALGDLKPAHVSLRKIEKRLDELSAYERKEYEALVKYVR